MMALHSGLRLFFLSLLLAVLLPDKLCVDAQAVSPRLALSNALFNAGCTNALIQHYIINASRQGVASSVVLGRLRDVSGYTLVSSDVQKWMAAVNAYDTALKKKASGK